MVPWCYDVGMSSFHQKSEAGEPASRVVAHAEFDPKLKAYEFWGFVLVMVATVIGIAAIPFWVLGFGQWRSRRYFESLSCVLTERTLEFGKGFFFRVEKTVPLDRIQDLTVKEGPLLRAFGLCTLRVETAGQSAPQGSSEADLQGIVDPREFRAAVLEQRRRLLAEEAGAEAAAAPPDAPETAATLGEIRDVLARIEELLRNQIER